MDDINKPKDELPPNEEEIVDLFFGEDDSKPVDFGKGRPKNEEPKPKKKPEKKIDKEEETFLEKQIKLLKRFEKRQEKLENKQEEQELEKEDKQRIRNLIRSEKNKKHKIPRASHLTKYKPTNNVLYADRGVVQTTSCDHEEMVRYTDELQVTTVCKKCSRYKEWLIKEWLFYNEKRHKENRK